MELINYADNVGRAPERGWQGDKRHLLKEINTFKSRVLKGSVITHWPA